MLRLWLSMPTAPAANFTVLMPAALGRAKEILGRLARYLVTIEADGPAPEGNSWQVYWGATYGPELKRWLLAPVFEKLEKEGKIGDLVVDAVSGAAPVTDLLPAKGGRKRVLVDIAGENRRAGDEQRIRLDAEKVGDAGTLSYRKAVLRVCKFLEMEPGAAKRDRVDTIVFSDLLNYVDFRNVLRGFAGFLKAGGRFVIVNLPIRGNRELFSDKGLKDNRELYRWLGENGFEIEYKGFPKRSRDDTGEAEELIVLVARKCGGD